MKKYDSMPLWKVVAVFPLVRSLRLVSNPSGERFQTSWNDNQDSGQILAKRGQSQNDVQAIGISSHIAN